MLEVIKIIDAVVLLSDEIMSDDGTIDDGSLQTA